MHSALVGSSATSTGGSRGSGDGPDEAYDDNSDLIEYLLKVQGSITDNILQSKYPADEASKLLPVQNGEY
jgi:hypothetical protein